MASKSWLLTCRSKAFCVLPVTVVPGRSTEAFVAPTIKTFVRLLTSCSAMAPMRAQFTEHGEPR